MILLSHLFWASLSLTLTNSETKPSINETMHSITITKSETTRPLFLTLQPASTKIVRTSYPSHIPTVTQIVPKKDCTLFGKIYRSGMIFYPGNAVRPKCVRCNCFDGNYFCEMIHNNGNMIGQSICASHYASRCESVLQNYISKDCSNPATADCNSWRYNITWSQNGCKYTCKNYLLHTEFIDDPWCQRLTQQTKYCATKCPDKHNALKRFGQYFTLCKRKEAIVYNHELCDGKYDCEDRTDEENCTYMPCKVEEGRILDKSILWNKTKVGKFAAVNCSSINAEYRGVIKRSCSSNNFTEKSSSWGIVDPCGCIPKNDTDFSVDTSSATNIKELIVAAQKLYKISLKAMYYHNYLNKTLQLIHLANNMDWETTKGKYLSHFILLIDKIVVEEKVICNTTEDHETKSRIANIVRNFTIANVVSRQTVQARLKPDGGEGIISLTAYTYDLELDLESLWNKLQNNKKFSKENIQSFEETPEVKSLVMSYEESERRSRLLLLEVITSAISLIAVCFTLVIFALLRMPNSTRMLIHKNLLVSFGMFSAMLISGVAASMEMREKRAVCVVFLSFFYYFLLAVFTWMLLEGLHLIIILVLIFEMKKKRHGTLLLVGWGIPLLILGTLWAIDRNAFLDSKICLNIGDRVWLIKAPILGIIIINFLIGAVVLVTIFRQQSKKTKKTMKLSKSLAKAFLVLSPLLGFFWLFSIFVDEHIIFAYLSATLNTLTGLAFFVFHCLLDKQVQSKAKHSNIRGMRLLLSNQSSTSHSNDQKKEWHLTKIREKISDADGQSSTKDGISPLRESIV